MIATAYGITDDSQFESKTAGYDVVNDYDGSVYKDIPMMFWASNSDTMISKAQNTTLFASKVNAAGGNVTVVNSTGDHGDSSNYDGQAVLDFFNQH